MENSAINEDMATKAIEKQTVKVPSDAFLFTALGTIGAAMALKIMGRAKDALFVGQWAAPILILGLYNKVVKQEEAKKREHNY